LQLLSAVTNQDFDDFTLKQSLSQAPSAVHTIVSQY